jgi:2-keto-4-pentenoate hydratase/2-oxohepta-3-ene-1,7-dioic acid hydratase in catechol pathway
VEVPATEPDGLDWEVELAAIVGTTLHEAQAEQAALGILGYTPFNDISGRASQIQSATLSTGQWAIGKNLDNSGAIGSVITTSDAYDPRGKRLSTRVDGVLMQDGNTADMVFDVPTLIQFISKTLTLKPGDLIATGTPAGVGFGMNPRRYAPAGSVIEVEIEGLGSVLSPIVARPAR